MLRSRTPEQVRARASELDLRLTSPLEDLEQRLADDEATLESLRRFDRTATTDDGDGDGTRALPGMGWGGARTAPSAPPVHASPDSAAWITVFQAPRVVPGGPLSGFEVGVKDLMSVEGCAVTAGTRAHRAPASAEDADAVGRLREAGATIRGTTNLHALAYGATGTSSDWGVPPNPASSGSMPGGSSSGSASAVADGSAALTLGTDTSGSIRIPAALCGVVGLKPTRGLVSVRGCHPLSPVLDHIGPLSQTVDVAAAAMGALAGWDDWSLPREPMSAVQIGVLAGYFDQAVDAPVRAALDEAITLLRASGAELDEVDLPLAHHIPGAQLAILGTDALKSNLGTLREHGVDLPPDVRLRLEAGLARTGEQYAVALELAEAWQRQVDVALQHHHVLLSATTAIAAPPADATETVIDGRSVKVQFSLTRFTMPFNLSGHPAITLPFRDSRGTLIGIQLVGRASSDQQLLGLAAHLEPVLGMTG